MPPSSRSQLGRTLLVLGALGASAASAGCSGHALTIGADDGGPANPLGAGGAGSSSRSPLCDTSGGTERTFLDEPDATALLAGTWALCSGPGLVFASEQPSQAGVELTTDLHWYALDSTPAGLARASGFQASGTYRFQPPQDLEYGPAAQAILFFGVDYSFNTVSMLDSPRKIRWQFMDPLDTVPSIYARLTP